MTIKKLNSMPYANAFVEQTDDGAINLYSYTTLVCTIKPDDSGFRWLTCNGLYSATTRKHISAFMREFTDYSYYTAKDLYLRGETYCLDTGEIKDL